MFSNRFPTILPTKDDPFDNAKHKIRLHMKREGEKMQKKLVDAVGQIDPDAAEKLDKAIDNTCNFVESVGNTLRQQDKRRPPLESPFPQHDPLKYEDEAVTAAQCQPADHLFRDGGGIGASYYTHHAIYLGNGRVMHYAHDSYGDICIHEADFEDFAEGHTVYRMRKSESPLRYSREEAVRRARSRAWEQEYNLLTNNCENFVRWCRCGHPDK